MKHSLATTLYHAFPSSSPDWLDASTPLFRRLMSITPASVAYHANTLWLFTESDFMTTMVPISLFAMVAAPLTSPSNIPHLVFWLWFHLLAFNTSNQTTSFEDATNKPDRPIPAGRITVEHALILRWVLMPMCWALSLAYSKETMFASMALALFTWMYNELKGNGRSAITRYLLNGLGFAAFEAGTTLVARDDKTNLDGAGWLAILLSGLIFATTIYAQDFRDVVGDAEINRDTIPLRFGAPSRPVLMAGVMAWSVGLSFIWQVDIFTTVAFVALAAFAGGRFVLKTTVDDDRRNYFWYNIWVTAAHVLPGYWRFFHSA
ncbi:S-adenosyl-L-methionine-dependent methyltransferase [Mycena indigotica]|uniref:S-adenosyl-L-methionine-dependent methyltransferase n=1 Tax=Mycena indigotica TaxID=2126181 RepID=A0A8H6T058_9AGAR|nr:S-adenosyl-L-methionine-dependent methyltransferase [Mycena indigotica]KAF7309253.1 S-adenosyl-L-methionine-dependent methyltransferase [Mycena indigotica]